MRRRCQACGGPFVGNNQPFCWRRLKLRQQEELDLRVEVALRTEELEQVAQWARQMLDANCLVLDTETTGLDGYVVQIAVIDSQGSVLLDSLVQPDAEIEEGAAQIHGITPALVATAPRFAEISPRLHEVLKGRDVCVYNMPFDRGVLLRERERMGDKPGVKVLLYGARWHDVMIPYATYVGEPGPYEEYRWQRLPGGDHTALGDCQATLAVLQELAAWPGEVQA